MKLEIPVFQCCCCCSVARLYNSLQPHGLYHIAHQTPLSFTIFQSLLKLMSIELATLPKHLILCRPLLHQSR